LFDLDPEMLCEHGLSLVIISLVLQTTQASLLL